MDCALSWEGLKGGNLQAACAAWDPQSTVILAFTLTTYMIVKIYYWRRHRRSADWLCNIVQNSENVR